MYWIDKEAETRVSCVKFSLAFIEPVHLQASPAGAVVPNSNAFA
jgi:hypothetical protein